KAKMFFDDDLLSGAQAQGVHPDVGAGAPQADFEDGAANGSPGSGALSSVETLSATASRRKRGSRGGAGSKTSPEKRWRSGAVPQPPSFDGDIEADPYCYRHYRRRLLRWVEITKEYLPGNEQALRALENLKGEAEVEMEEVEDSRYNVPNGIQVLLQDLERSFGAKEMFRQGGTIREFENVGRLQGESVHAFARRFRLLERKLKDNQVPEYPEVARVIKLLDGLRLDEKSVSALLLAAGNKYDMRAILNAVSIQYPAGMTITGLPRLRADRRGRGRGTSSSSAASTTASSARSGPSGKRWRHWNTTWEEVDDPSFEAEDGDQPPEDAPLYQDEGAPPDEEAEDVIYEENEQADEEDDGAAWGDYDAGDGGHYDENEDLHELMQALTVTSKRLAGLVQARGFYQTDGKGKSKGKGKGKSKGKGRGGKSAVGSKPFGKSSGKKGQPSKSKGKGKTDNALHQQRLQGSLCLGCGASDHWLKDCPSYTVQNAQLTSAAIDGLVLDAEGTASIWAVTVSANEPQTDIAATDNGKQHELYQAPSLSEFEPFTSVPKNPSILLQYYQGDSSAYIIADTGCQRQVAGEGWHVRKRSEIEPLCRLEYPDVCKFSFGPSDALTSQGRYVYPAAIAGKPLAMCVSSVNAKAGIRVRICDLCGTRYVLLPSGTSVLATPKASPSAKTPLNLPEHVMEAIRGKRPAAGKPQVARSQGSSRPSSISSPAYAPPPPPRLRPRSTTTAPKAAPKMVPRAKSMMQAASASSSLPIPRRRQWHGSESDRMSTGTGVYHEDMDWSEAAAPAETTEWVEPNWAMPDDYDHYEGSENSQFDPNDLIPHDFEEEEADEEHGDHDLLRGSADEPLMPEDAGAFKAKAGTLKRVLGNEKSMLDAWQLEQRAYAVRAQRARSTRVFGSDLIEVYGGNAEITRVGLLHALRVLQPVDKIYGHDLSTGNDFETLRNLLLKHRPFLVIFEFPCTLWSNIQHLNYDKLTLDELRAKQLCSIREMCKTIRAIHEAYGGHFLLENPAYTPFWQHPEIMQRYDIPNVELQVGHMCCYDLRGKDDKLLKKPTAWMSDLSLLLKELGHQCPGPELHDHGQVLGGNSSRSQVYTTTLAQAVIRGLHASLKEAGDERYNRAHESDSQAWQADVESDELVLPDWQPPGETSVVTVFFLDVNRHEDSWLPLLKEAEAQLKDKVRPDRVIPTNTPFGEQLKTLVPWKIIRIQICRTPMQRRLPLEVLQAGAQHRGAALWLSDGSVSIEAEAVSRILAQSAGRFSTPVRVAVFFFGTAPATSLNETANELPETDVKVDVTGDKVDEVETMRPHQPGFRDISFPGLKGAPKWLLQVMRRLHTNLGHPSTATMVRHLTASGASETAIQAARHLRCEVCLRVQPPREPRPAKPFTARRFNDRLNMDVLWLKDISGRAHGYLSQVDEATSYHVLSYMRDRTEEETIRLLINGWFSFFGPPDELVLDSDGSFRGFRFETLQAQCAVKVRYAPADAHYQMGKVERHGQAIRYIVQRLVSQFAPLGADELNVVAVMSAAAKNNLMRRAGSSPAQWVYGRAHKIPGALLSSGGSIESCSLHDDSSRLRLVEQIRAKAMMLFHQFESDAALRAALLRKPRPARGPFAEGQRIAYYRAKNSADGEGTLEGYRQGVIVAVDGSTLWIRNTRGRLVSASKEQVRSIGGEEEWWAPSQADLDLLKKSDQDLDAKHSPLAFRLPDGSVPRAGDDQAVAAELDFQLRAASPAPRPVLDADGRPVLDPSGQPDAVAVEARLRPDVLYHQCQNNRSPVVMVRDRHLALRRSSYGTSDMQRDLESLMNQMPSDATSRGTKRPADATLEAPSQSSLRREPNTEEEHAENLLLFCRDCGEQHRVSVQGVDSCSRCLSTRTVSSPMHVVSWFDEVKEREALEQCFENRTSSSYSASSAMQAVSFENEFDPAQDKNNSCPSHEFTGRLDVLHRHGRDDASRVGWDGSPCELQPLFQSDNYLTAAHHLGCHEEDVNAWTTSTTRATSATTSRTSARRPTLASEHVAKQLLRAQDFRASTLHQLLEAVEFPSNKRNCLDDSSGGFLLGLYSHGNFTGITKATGAHRQLAKYVMSYMRHHGLKGQTSSIYISRNATAKCHKDSHNLAGSLNWVTSVGSYTGGELWVECSSDCPPADAVYRMVNGKNTPGFLVNTRNQVLSFRPDCFHETMPFKGTRYSIVAYTTRSLPNAPSSARRRLQRLGFNSGFANWDVWQAYVDESSGARPWWLDETVAEAYPARSWRPPEEGEVMAMDTSGDDAHDGAQEPPSRAQRQALKKELPWQAMSEAEVPQFIQAVLDEWAEWRKWSSCRPIHVDLSRIDPTLILPSRICYRWKVKGAVEEWNDSSLLYKLSAPVYGQANAPRRWYVHVANTLGGLGWTAHTLDPCLWLYREEIDGVLKVTAVLGVHVDDMIMAALHGKEKVLEAIHGSFTWGSEWESKDFTFVGRHIRQHEDWTLTVDQASYIAEVPITKISLAMEEKLSDHPEMITEFRSGIGSLQWMAGTTRGDIAADTSLLQKPPSQLTMADLAEVNGVLRYVRATRDAYYKVIPIDFEEMLLIAYGDSAWANAPGGKSQGGLLVAATSKKVLQTPQPASLLEWKSYRHQRVLRSTLAAEAASLDKAEDYGNFIATMLSEMIDGRYTATLREVPIIEVLPVTDARSLWDAIHRLSTTFAEKRVEISIATLRQQCRALRWPTA
ncbi:RE1, partial [Symbiodinium necroappetens]